MKRCGGLKFNSHRRRTKFNSNRLGNVQARVQRKGKHTKFFVSGLRLVTQTICFSIPQKVVFQASCCQHWYECSECHDEANDHLFEFEKKLKLFCKTCNRTFECNLKLMSTKDKYCFSCGTCWCIPGKKTAVTHKAKSCLFNGHINYYF